MAVERHFSERGKGNSSDVLGRCSCEELLKDVPGLTWKNCPQYLFGFECRKGQRSGAVGDQKTTRDAWFQSYGLLRSENMPENLRELHLINGYRPVPSSVMYCFRSVFHPTNETLNFWTHVIALLIMIKRFHFIFSEKLFGTVDDPMYYPLWVYSAGCCLMLLGSSLAHCFSCISSNARETCWFCDYASITLSSVGAAVAYHFYVCPYECMGISTEYYIEWMGVAGVIGHAMCCYSRSITSKIKYAMRSSVFVVLYSVSFIPCSYLCFTHSGENFNTTQNSSVIADLRCHIGMTSFGTHHFLVTVLSLSTVIFNVTKFPEKFFPGTFDIIGHSHQFLHITIALAFYYQSYLIEDSMVDMNHLLQEKIVTADDFNINWWNSIGTMATVGISCFLTSCFFTSRLPPEKQRKQE